MAREFLMGLAVVSLLVGAVAAPPQAAAAVTGGPYIDFKGYLGTDITTVNTRSEVQVNGVPMIVRDSITVGHPNSSDTTNYAMVGVSYLTPVDTKGGDPRYNYTTIYGLDPNPTNTTSMAMIGLNSISSLQEFTLTGETVYDATGTGSYTGSGGLVSIAGLAGSYPDFNLTPLSIAEGASGNVYVFNTTIPLAALGVPEPSTIVLLGMGALGFLGWAWRRRKHT